MTAPMYAAAAPTYTLPEVAPVLAAPAALADPWQAAQYAGAISAPAAYADPGFLGMPAAVGGAVYGADMAMAGAGFLGMGLAAPTYTVPQYAAAVPAYGDAGLLGVGMAPACNACNAAAPVFM